MSTGRISATRALDNRLESAVCVFVWVLHSPSPRHPLVYLQLDVATDCLCPASNTIEKAPLELSPLPRGTDRGCTSDQVSYTSSRLKLWTHGPGCSQSCLEHGGQDGHEHIDVGIETVNRECLGKHETAWHAERELQSNL